MSVDIQYKKLSTEVKTVVNEMLDDQSTEASSGNPGVDTCC
ncbi:MULTISPECIES: hypothetical protein [Haloarcula]|nr:MULTISPECIES: hypothetical protein [Haloarcula]